MKLLNYAVLSLLLAVSCNKRRQTGAEGIDPSSQSNNGTGLPGSNDPANPSGTDNATPDNRPISATVSTQTFSCKSLDAGIYWFGKGDQAQKATAMTRSTFFDPKKPTVIYVHGWQSGSHKLERRGTFNYGKYDPIYGVKVDAADAWVDAGWNIGIFYWNQISDESAPTSAEDKVWGESSVTWKDCDGKPQPVPGSPSDAGEFFYNEFLIAMKNYQGSNVRLAGHSLGNQLVTKLADKLETQASAGKIPENLIPKRVALIDPWWSDKSMPQNRADSLRSSIQEMKAKGIIFEWYKTSKVNDNNGSDENLELIPIIGQTEIFPDYYSSFNNMSRHMSAPFLYFLGFKDGAPLGCGNKTSACTELAPSAATSDERMKELMMKAARWQQVDGRETAPTADNTYEGKSR